MITRHDRLLSVSMRRMHKQPVGVRDDWNHGLEVGDRVYTWVKVDKTAMMDDLVQSNGKNKASAGELTPRRVRKNGRPRIATVKDGVWYWTDLLY